MEKYWLFDHHCPYIELLHSCYSLFSLLFSFFGLKLLSDSWSQASFLLHFIFLFLWICVFSMSLLLETWNHSYICVLKKDDMYFYSLCTTGTTNLFPEAALVQPSLPVNKKGHNSSSLHLQIKMVMQYYSLRWFVPPTGNECYPCIFCVSVYFFTLNFCKQDFWWKIMLQSLKLGTLWFGFCWAKSLFPPFHIKDWKQQMLMNLKLVLRPSRSHSLQNRWCYNLGDWCRYYSQS